MAEISPIFLALLTGFVAGLLLSMPIGPVNLTIHQRRRATGISARRAGWPGRLLDGTHLLRDRLYGLYPFFEVNMIKTLMEVFSFVFFSVHRHEVSDAPRTWMRREFGAAAQKLSARVDEKFKPESAFMTGFVRVLGNFGVLLFWIFLAGSFLSHDLVADTLASKGACIAGCGARD